MNEKSKDLPLSQVPELDEGHIILEPLSKHTAPALGLALTRLDEKYEDDVVFSVFPSDFIVRNVGEFYYTYDTAVEAVCKNDVMATIGVVPDTPSQHYGYIQFTDDYDDIRNNGITYTSFEKGIRKALVFAEKPDIKTAERFILSGEFLVNVGILIARKDTLWKAFEKDLNYHYEQFHKLQSIVDTETFDVALKNLYMTFNKTSIDYALLEHSDNIFVVKGTFFWSDVYDWSELYNISMKDALDNVQIGNIISIDCENTLVLSGDKTIALLGVEDIVVVNTEKATLVCKRSEAYRIDEITNELKRKRMQI